MPFQQAYRIGADKAFQSDLASLDGTPLRDILGRNPDVTDPLVMAGTGTQTWDQATLNIDSRLSNITVGESRRRDHRCREPISLPWSWMAGNSSQTILPTPTGPTTTASDPNRCQEQEEQEGEDGFTSACAPGSLAAERKADSGEVECPLSREVPGVCSMALPFGF